MMKIFYLLFLAIPSLLYSQSSINSGSSPGKGFPGRGAAGFEFTPEVTTVHDTAGVIELAGFTAKVFNGAMELEWKVAMKTDDNHFTIERSFDGTSFDAVGEVNAVKNDSTPTGYSFTDDGLLHSLTYYRLKQADLHGHSRYSATIRVSLARQKVNEIKVYPDPNSGAFRTELPFPFAYSDYQISVYDQLGQLAEYTTQHISGDKLLFELDNQPAGVYVLVLEANGKTYANSFEKPD